MFNYLRIIKYVSRFAVSSIRIFLLRLRGAKIGKKTILESNLAGIKPKNIDIGYGCVIEKNIRMESLSRLKLGSYVKLKQGIIIDGNQTEPKTLVIGDNSWIGEESIINVYDDVLIKDNVGIGARSQIWTHGFFSNISDGYPNKIAPVTICKGAWLPPSCIVLPGVTIGKNTIIGTGSVITNVIQDNVFATGIPCVVKVSDQWKYRQKFSIDQKINIIRQALEKRFKSLGFLIENEIEDCIIVSFSFYKIKICFNDSAIPDNHGCQIIFTTTKLSVPRKHSCTWINILDNTYGQTNTFAEWLVVRGLLDSCILRIVPA